MGEAKSYMPMCGYLYAMHEKRSLGPQSSKITQLQRAEDYKNHTALLNTCTPWFPVSNLLLASTSLHDRATKFASLKSTDTKNIPLEFRLAIFSLIQAKTSHKSVWQNSGEAEPLRSSQNNGLELNYCPLQNFIKTVSAEIFQCPKRNLFHSWRTLSQLVTTKPSRAQILPEVVFTILSLDFYKDID